MARRSCTSLAFSSRRRYFSRSFFRLSSLKTRSPVKIRNILAVYDFSLHGSQGVQFLQERLEFIARYPHQGAFSSATGDETFIRKHQGSYFGVAVIRVVGFEIDVAGIGDESFSGFSRTSGLEFSRGRCDGRNRLYSKRSLKTKYLPEYRRLPDGSSCRTPL